MVRRCVLHYSNGTVCITFIKLTITVKHISENCVLDLLHLDEEQATVHTGSIRRVIDCLIETTLRAVHTQDI